MMKLFAVLVLALFATASASLRFSAVGAGTYGPPPCTSGKEVQISGVPGVYCAPSCSGQGSSCPAPSSGSAKAECVVEQQGSSKPSLCALICDPSASGSCPTGATCQAIQGVGICTFPQSS